MYRKFEEKRWYAWTSYMNSYSFVFTLFNDIHVSLKNKGNGVVVLRFLSYVWVGNLTNHRRKLEIKVAMVRW